MIKAGKRVAIYCCVSTKDKGQTTENQCRAVRCRAPAWPHLSKAAPKSPWTLKNASSPPMGSDKEVVR